MADTSTVLDVLCELGDQGFEVAHALDACEASDLSNRPVIWNTRLKTTAGRADYWANSIELNPRLKVEGPEAVYKTFIHELAHLVAGPGAKHGARWERICLHLGGTGMRCHTYSTMKRKQRADRVFATCDACGYELRRTRPLMENRVYSHKKCGGKFNPVS